MSTDKIMFTTADTKHHTISCIRKNNRILLYYKQGQHG